MQIQSDDIIVTMAARVSFTSNCYSLTTNTRAINIPLEIIVFVQKSSVKEPFCTIRLFYTCYFISSQTIGSLLGVSISFF